MNPRRRRRFWIGALTGVVLLVVAVVGVGAVRADKTGSAYQPLRYGRAGSGIDLKSTVKVDIATSGSLRGQRYIPPQPAATGALTVSLVNTGAHAVTIESVGLPRGRYPLLPRSSDPARYVRLAGPFPQVTAASPRIAGAVLRPGEDVMISIPFRTPGCWQPGRSVIKSFIVRTRYQSWTHRFAVSFVDYPAQSDGIIFGQAPCPSVTLTGR